jgi:hypothetical protein
MTLQRVQMLIEPVQRRKLADLAKAHGKSIAEMTRQVIDIGLEQLAQNDEYKKMEAALEAAQLLRDRIRLRVGKPLDINVVEDIWQIREERDDELFRRG